MVEDVEDVEFVENVVHLFGLYDFRFLQHLQRRVFPVGLAPRKLDSSEGS